MANQRIPLKNIKKIDILIASNMTAEDVWQKYEPDYLMNLALYDTNTGKNLTHMLDEGKKAGYLFSTEGIGIKGDENICWTMQTASDLRDFVGGAPTLLKAGEIHVDWGNKYSEYVDGIHKRTILGFNDTHLILCCTDYPLGIQAAAKTAKDLGMKYAINLDGGGSQHLQTKDKVYKRSTRKNASWLLVYLKPETDKKTETETTVNKDNGGATMTETQLREMVVCIMTGFLGRNEADGSHREIVDIYNSKTPRARNYKLLYTDPWCAATVSATFIKADLTDIAPTECSCTKMIELYKAIGRWEERDSYVPKPGDILMFCWNDEKNFAETDLTKNPNHVGLVVAVTSENIRVIDGNHSNAVKYRDLEVNGRYIRGYCLPDFASKATKPAETAKQTVTKTTVTCDGKTYDAIIVDGTTYAPVRALAESLGRTVHYNSQTKEVTIV